MRMAVAGIMRVFRACPFPTVGASATRHADNSRSHDGHNSLVAGKNAGNFTDSAPFCEHPSRKHQRIQVFADEFPTQTEQGIFLPAQGIFLPSRE
jgi:hypothetical protein